MISNPDTDCDADTDPDPEDSSQKQIRSVPTFFVHVQG
jgi:hypothetical protein